MNDEQWKFNEWVCELAKPFWLKDAQKEGEFFDTNGFARALLSASKVAVPDGWKLAPDHANADAIVSSLYRRFKDWSKRGFGPEDVTWCEVKADVLALLAASPAAPSPAQTERGAFDLKSFESALWAFVDLSREWEKAYSDSAKHYEDVDVHKSNVERELRYLVALYRKSIEEKDGLLRNLRSAADQITQARAALQAAPAAEIPKGQKLVPVSLTHEMYNAVDKAGFGHIHEIELDGIWEALLASAPQPAAENATPAQSGGPVAWRDAIKSYPSPDMTLAPQPSPTAVVLDDERAAFEAWYVLDVPENRVDFFKRELAEQIRTESGPGFSAWTAWQARAASPQPAQTERALTDHWIDMMAIDACVAGDSKGRLIFTKDAARAFARDVQRALLTAAQPASGGNHG